jgi:hypothetical protein
MMADLGWRMADGLLLVSLCALCALCVRHWTLRAVRLWQNRTQELLTLCRQQDARIRALERHNIQLQQRLHLDIHVHQDEDDADWWKAEGGDFSS